MALWQFARAAEVFQVGPDRARPVVPGVVAGFAARGSLGVEVGSAEGGGVEYEEAVLTDVGAPVWPGLYAAGTARRVLGARIREGHRRGAVWSAHRGSLSGRRCVHCRRGRPSACLRPPAESLVESVGVGAVFGVGGHHSCSSAEFGT